MKNAMKKIHRFLQKNPEPDPHVITDPALIHQIAHVLKLAVGETIGLFEDGAPERIVTIGSITPDVIELHDEHTEPLPKEPHRYVRAAIAIPKSDHFEFIVQKLSELGVREIIPLITDRTIKTGVRRERLQTISDEAVELSGNIHRVIMHEPQSLTDALKNFSTVPWIVFDAAGTESITGNECVYAIGPEGGWSDRERDLFAAHNATMCSLAPRTLRAETAAILGAYHTLWE